MNKITNTVWEERVQAGNTTYTADSHPNNTKPRQRNNMNVNGYKNTEDTHKQTNIYLKPGLRHPTSHLFYPSPIRHTA